MLFRFSDVDKSYAGTEVLRGVTFQVNPGEKIGLVGRNGAGKTTIFRLLTGKESADSGDIVRAGGLKLGLLEQHIDLPAGETVHTAALSAFKEVHDIESRMRELEVRMATDHSQPTLDEYAELQHAYELADGFTYAAKAESVLLGLGFSRENWDLRTDVLSGGQVNRLGMARVLLSAPDVLLLDEPTNHLDVDAVEWLETFLQSYPSAYVVISHDRYFLDRITTKILEIDRGRAVTYSGNYSKFLTERELRREQQQREYENQRSMIAKTEEFIRRNLEGQKTKQAKSRRNMLQRLERLDAVQTERSGGNFALKNVERAGNNVLTVDELSVGYGDKALARNIGFSLHRGEVLGIIGGNGTGKTTLLRTLLGELPPLGGEILWGTKTDVGYYSQNLRDLEPRNEIIQELRRVAPMVENVQLRSFLALFLFFGEDVFKKVGDLSGGEKGRLALAKLIYSQKNVLILDEPTNHLDIPSREALETALEEYEGTIITVSHDRFFLDKIATQILAFEPGGRIENFNGNYTEFHDWREAGSLSRSVQTPRAKDTEMASQQNENSTAASNGSFLSKNQREKIQRRIRDIEALISKLESEASILTRDMASPELAADFERLRVAAAAHEDIQEKIRGLYVEWEQAADSLK